MLLTQTSSVRVGEWLGAAGHGRNALVDPRDVADVGAAVLCDPGRWGRHHVVTGPELLDWDDTVAIAGRVLGRPLRYLHLVDPRASTATFSDDIDGDAMRRAWRSTARPSPGR